jgi:tripartite-type tricarboxylate transporter receptor subunit TctC
MKDATMTLSRRRFLQVAAAAGALSAVSGTARAQAYPSRPVTVLVFVPAGGTPDIVARLIGQPLSQRLGQSVIADNRPGASGNLALQAAARAPADGYTLLQVATPHSINVSLYEKSPVNVLRDIEPIASTNFDSFVMLVHPSFTAKTIPEFIAYAKANPGKVNLGSSGTANLAHLSAELFRMNTGIDWVHIPFRGTPAAHSALLAGEVQVMFDAVGSSISHIQAGAIRALGVSATKRMPVLPDVPPISETVPGYEVTGWLGYGAPKGTPVDILDKLNREINAVVADPAISARLLEIGSTPLTGSRADFAKLVSDDAEKWSKVVKFSGLRAD